jgi:sterol desaturase/sphingolipid hydroxylase (fatty acid hydroxylase superfamily)
LAHTLTKEAKEAKEASLWNDLLFFIPVSFAYELIFDFFHYGTHRFLHSVPTLYRTIHKKHHETTVINANTTFNHTPLDLLITNTIPILCASAIIPVSPYTLTILFWFKTVLEISGHTGKDSSGSFIQCIYLPEALGISLYSRDHNNHHLNPTVNFSKRFSLWDRLFGTKEKLSNQVLKESQETI